MNKNDIKRNNGINNHRNGIKEQWNKETKN